MTMAIASGRKLNFKSLTTKVVFMFNELRCLVISYWLFALWVRDGADAPSSALRLTEWLSPVVSEGVKSAFNELKFVMSERNN